MQQTIIILLRHKTESLTYQNDKIKLLKVNVKNNIIRDNKLSVELFTRSGTIKTKIQIRQSCKPLYLVFFLDCCIFDIPINQT